MILYRDKIESFNGSWGSGIATLQFQSGRSINCENAPTARALMDVVDCVAPGHSIDSSKLKGLDIVYAYDEMGLIMGGFNLYDHYLWDCNPEIELGSEIEIGENEDD